MGTFHYQIFKNSCILPSFPLSVLLYERRVLVGGLPRPSQEGIGALTFPITTLVILRAKFGMLSIFPEDQILLIFLTAGLVCCIYLTVNSQPFSRINKRMLGVIRAGEAPPSAVWGRGSDSWAGLHPGCRAGAGPHPGPGPRPAFGLTSRAIWWWPAWLFRNRHLEARAGDSPSHTRL